MSGIEIMIISSACLAVTVNGYYFYNHFDTLFNTSYIPFN